MFERGTQFLILNNPILRDEEIFKEPNKYIPERWLTDKNLEKSYYSIMFNQGPQRCPGKELSILLLQLSLYYYLKYSGVINKKNDLDCSYTYQNGTTPQMLNPCILEFHF